MDYSKEIANYGIYYTSGCSEVPTHRAYIGLYDDNHQMIGRLVFTRGKEDPNLQSELDPHDPSFANIIFHESEFTTVLDILRNEKPLFIDYNSNWKLGHIRSTQEPIGEGEPLLKS